MGFKSKREKLSRRWNAGTDDDRIMPTAVVTDLPVMAGIRRDGMSVHPLEPDAAEFAMDDRHTAAMLHFHLSGRGV